MPRDVTLLDGAVRSTDSVRSIALLGQVIDGICAEVMGLKPSPVDYAHGHPKHPAQYDAVFNTAEYSDTGRALISVNPCSAYVSNRERQGIEDAMKRERELAQIALGATDDVSKLSPETIALAGIDDDALMAGIKSAIASLKRDRIERMVSAVTICRLSSIAGDKRQKVAEKRLSTVGSRISAKTLKLFDCEIVAKRATWGEVGKSILGEIITRWEAVAGEYVPLQYMAPEAKAKQGNAFKIFECDRCHAQVRSNGEHKVRNGAPCPFDNGHVKCDGSLKERIKGEPSHKSSKGKPLTPADILGYLKDGTKPDGSTAPLASSVEPKTKGQNKVSHNGPVLDPQVGFPTAV